MPYVPPLNIPYIQADVEEFERLVRSVTPDDKPRVLLRLLTAIGWLRQALSELLLTRTERDLYRRTIDSLYDDVKEGGCGCLKSTDHDCVFCKLALVVEIAKMADPPPPEEGADAHS